MRYLVVRYIHTPSGQMDELVEVSKKIRDRDWAYAAVILDFKTRQVVQASMDGVTVPRDWNRIRDFYHQHYSRLIEDLEAVYPIVTDKDSGSQ